jgi:hypothetical protein
MAYLDFVNLTKLNYEIHIIHNAFPGKTFERKCKESGQGKQKFDIVFFNFVSWYKKWVISNTGVKIVYQYCKVFHSFCIVMDVYLLMCVYYR